MPRSTAPRCGANSLPTDQELARVTEVNLFVIGAEHEVATLITSVWPRLAMPIVVRDRGQSLRLSPTSPPRTIVIYDVDTLTRQEQHALNQWLMAGNGRTRVVCSASEALWPLVEAGVFNDELYYRLNVMTIDLASLAR